MKSKWISSDANLFQIRLHLNARARVTEKRRREEKNTYQYKKKHALRVWSKRSKGMEQTLKEHQPDNTDINGIIYGSESSSDWRQEDNEKTGFVGCAYIF